MTRARIIGVGAYAPKRILTNEELERMIETSDEWIVQRTGIRERRIADESEATSDLALKAAQQALERAGVEPREIDLIVVGTTTGDMAFPTTANIVQHQLGCRNAGSMDLYAACSGSIYSLSVGEAGILDTDLYSDGRYGDLLIQPAGGSRYPATHETVDKRMHFCRMKGNEVFKVAVRMFGDCAERILSRNGITSNDLALFIPHQANLRIIEAAVKRLKVPMGRVLVNVDRYGNTGAASVYVALEEALALGRIKPGDLVLMAAFGGGFTWGAALLRW